MTYQIHPSCKDFFLFADVTDIYFETDVLSRLIKTVNKELKNWLDINRRALNIVKTNYVLFHHKKETT